MVRYNGAHVLSCGDWRQDSNLTIALAARFHEFYGVVAGTTLGMMLANVLVIYLGHKFVDRLPTKAVDILAAIIFVVLGGLALRTALYPAAHPAF
jgi:putative Ca2+/H+ antiporter (TMEM165/GDT1 family)